MKVLHIHRFGLNGGAGGATSMRRLHFGLRKAGIDSKILCVRKAAKSDHIVISKPSFLASKWNYYSERITKRFGLEDVLNANAFRIKGNQVYKDTDIINFHRVPDVFSYLAFPFLTRHKPAVFTLCEMWSITGHCRQSVDCERWKTGCGKCPYTHLPPAIKHDGTHIQWMLKNWIYGHSNFSIVAKSNWMAELVRQSMLKRFPVFHIPNGIDPDVYRPLDQKRCRALLNIPAGKKVILFVAQRITEFIKGGDLLMSALNSIPEPWKSSSVVLVFGKDGEAVSNMIDFPTINLGYLGDDQAKATVYSAADVFLCPSRAENFPNVVLESMACGTPTVAFNVSSLPDLVKPGITGLLADAENADSFGKQIVKLLEDNALRQKFGQNCREIVIKEYTIELLYKRYAEMYRQLITEHNCSN
jgi:glycosyltransferase involved in cell wall biosynthesis